MFVFFFFCSNLTFTYFVFNRKHRNHFSFRRVPDFLLWLFYSLRWPIYVLNSVVNTKLPAILPTDAAPQFLQKLSPFIQIFCLFVFQYIGDESLLVQVMFQTPHYCCLRFEYNKQCFKWGTHVRCAKFKPALSRTSKQSSSVRRVVIPLCTTRAGLLKSCFAFTSSSNARPTQLASCTNLNCIWRTELFSWFIGKNWYGEKRDSRRRFSNTIFQHIDGSPARRR